MEVAAYCLKETVCYFITLSANSFSFCVCVCVCVLVCVGGGGGGGCAGMGFPQYISLITSLDDTALSKNGVYS